MSVNHMCVWFPMGAKGGYQAPRNWSYRAVSSHVGSRNQT